MYLQSFQIMRTLILDTSGSFTTVLVVQDQELAHENIFRGRPAEHLHIQIHTSLKNLNIQPQDLNQIGVVIGPGSWTGLNIGVTAAKTLAQVLEIPLLPIRALDALVAGSAMPSWAIMNAGRNQCYYARYPLLEETEMIVGSIESVITEIEIDSSSTSVLEYGETFKEQFRDDPRYQSLIRLPSEALVSTMKTSTALRGSQIKGLIPAYLQPSHVERDASPSP